MSGYLIGVSQNLVASFILWAPAFIWHHKQVIKTLESRL